MSVDLFLTLGVLVAIFVTLMMDLLSADAVTRGSIVIVKLTPLVWLL